LSNKHEREALLTEYHVLNETVQKSRSDTFLVFSILIPSSLALVTFAVAKRVDLGKSIVYDLPVAGFIPLLTFLLVVPAYFRYFTAFIVESIYFERIFEIEKTLKIKGHKHAFKEMRKLKRRGTLYGEPDNRILWNLFFLALIIIYLCVAIWLFRETPVK